MLSLIESLLDVIGNGMTLWRREGKLKCVHDI
jgi:hypothetical protein